MLIILKKITWNNMLVSVQVLTEVVLLKLDEIWSAISKEVAESAINNLVLGLLLTAHVSTFTSSRFTYSLFGFGLTSSASSFTSLLFLSKSIDSDVNVKRSQFSKQTVPTLQQF
ncbi:hypothetical protein RND81_13G197500 [Saponaria officinalis]|uniref:Uncharacterized protein n=1 Tax=Saponaria officinalis TaxID=3572 RepID=A0AAW1GZV4_SAPOF